MSGRPNLQSVRAKLAETAQQQDSKLDEAIASKADKAMKASDLEGAGSAPAETPEPGETPSKVAKRSTSLYLSGAASRAIKTLAAGRGVRPHRIFEEALAEYLAKEENGGLDFHALNAKA